MPSLQRSKDGKIRGHRGELSGVRWRICSSSVLTSFKTSLPPAAHFLEEQELVEFARRKKNTEKLLKLDRGSEEMLLIQCD